MTVAGRQLVILKAHKHCKLRCAKIVNSKLKSYLHYSDIVCSMYFWILGKLLSERSNWSFQMFSLAAVFFLNVSIYTCRLSLFKKKWKWVERRSVDKYSSSLRRYQKHVPELINKKKPSQCRCFVCTCW